MHDFRIIIPVFNPPPCLLETLEALRSDGGIHAQVILIDDGSTNGIGDRIRIEFPEVTMIRGDGNLWWAGGMKVGMERALAEGAGVVVWLNHDCQPLPGTIASLVDEAEKSSIGAVSAWCMARGHEDFPVNPGFRDFKPIPVEELKAGGKIKVDGVNGNCVAMNAEAIRRVGLPETSRHPHYGDGPYTFRLHKAGFTNWVLPHARATLHREFERCIDEGLHASVWEVPLHDKLGYYLFSRRSKYHWKSKFWDSTVFRGPMIGWLAFLTSESKLIQKVIQGHFRGVFGDRETLVRDIVKRYEQRNHW